MLAQPGLTPDTFVVGTGDRLMPIKGFEYLIEPVAQLRRQHGQQESELVIVGDGPLKAVLRQSAERHGLSHDVEFSGMRHDVPKSGSISKCRFL